jgi:hypothetical protein
MQAEIRVRPVVIADVRIVALGWLNCARDLALEHHVDSLGFATGANDLRSRCAEVHSGGRNAACSTVLRLNLLHRHHA